MRRRRPFRSWKTLMIYTYCVSLACIFSAPVGIALVSASSTVDSGIVLFLVGCVVALYNVPVYLGNFGNLKLRNPDLSRKRFWLGFSLVLFTLVLDLVMMFLMWHLILRSK